MVSAPSTDVAQCLTDVSSYKGELATIWLGLSPLSAFRYLGLRRSFCLASLLLLLKWQLTFWNVLTSAHRICGAQREWPPSSRLNHHSPITTSPFVNPAVPQNGVGRGRGESIPLRSRTPLDYYQVIKPWWPPVGCFTGRSDTSQTVHMSSSTVIDFWTHFVSAFVSLKFHQKPNVQPIVGNNSLC